MSNKMTNQQYNSYIKSQTTEVKEAQKENRYFGFRGQVHVVKLTEDISQGGRRIL